MPRVRFGSWSSENVLDGVWSDCTHGLVARRMLDHPDGLSGQRSDQSAIVAIIGLMPTFMARVRLWARTESAISAATFGSVLVKKCVAPMRP